MPTGPLPPSDDYLGDGDRTTGEFQAELNNLQNWARQFQDQLDELSSTTPGEAFNRAVGDSAGQLTERGVGTAGTELVDNDRLDDEIDTRIGTTGNLGSVAVQDYQSQVVSLGNDFNASQQVKCVRIGEAILVYGVGENLTHVSASAVSSDAGDIPAFARPSAGQTSNTYFSSSVLNARVTIFSDGTFLLEYRNQDGSANSRTDSIDPPTITLLA